MNIWAAFLTGLTTGGITCVAVQGGLLAAVIANQKNHRSLLEAAANKPIQLFSARDWLPITSFLGAKLIAHTLLGFALGSIGALFTTSHSVALFFQFLTGIFMLATVGNLLDAHPIFRYVVFQPPHFLQRFIRKQTKNQDLFTPAILGMFTIFIPCGITQAMEIVALQSGNGFSGAAVMAAFTLGTMPMFAAIGLVTNTVSGIWQQRLQVVTAAIVFVLAIHSLNGVAVSLNSPITAQKVAGQVELMITPPAIYRQKLAKQQQNYSMAPIVNGVQKIKIDVKENGYYPNFITVRQNIPVEIDLETKETFSCANQFELSSFDIHAQLGPTERKTVAFTPTEVGEYPFNCSMGMFDGKIVVVKG
jgi:uncharacterized protein